MRDGSSHSPKRAQFLQTTAVQLADAFMHRIAAGAYAPGNILPSCREVARDLRVDKNTVNKAYKILERRGIVKAVPGKGVVVLERSHASLSQAGVQENIRSAIWQARAFGIEEDELWKLIGEAVWQFYGATRVKVAFIECNWSEAHEWGRLLSERVKLPVQPVLLAEFVSDPQRFLDSYDIIATTFNHLAAVIGAAGDQKSKVIGLHALPVIEDALRIAQVEKGAKVAVVCTTEPGINMLNSLVRTYNANIHVLPCLAADEQEVADAVAKADVIVDTSTSHARVLSLHPRVPVITVSFVLDENSIALLKHKIMALTRERLASSNRREMVKENP